MAEKVIRAWGGFVNGKLHRKKEAWSEVIDALAVYATRRAAKEDYQDVRRVSIVYEVEDSDGHG